MNSPFYQSHNTVFFLGGGGWGRRGVFALKQWIVSSLKHEKVPGVSNLYCICINDPQNALHYGMVKIVNSKGDIRNLSNQSERALNAIHCFRILPKHSW